MSIPRLIRLTFQALEQSEGVGRPRPPLNRHPPNLRTLSPFLMLDHFTIHPRRRLSPTNPHHRGQETITYLLQQGARRPRRLCRQTRGTIWAGGSAIQ